MFMIRTKSTRRLLRHLYGMAATHPLARKLARRALQLARENRYRRAIRKNEVEPTTVVFECYAGRAYTCSPRAIYQTMLKDPRFDSYRFYWVFRQPQLDVLGDDEAADLEFGPNALQELKRSSLIRYLSPEYHDVHARAGTWVANYILPTHMHPREGQRYLQTWHGTPLKRLGCDLGEHNRSAMYSMPEVHERYRREGERFTWLLSPSPFATDALGSAFCMDDQRRRESILEIGYPRNDELTAADKRATAKVRRRLGVNEADTVILYAPTFRDDQHKRAEGYTLEHLLDFEALRTRLGDGFTILFRAHYLIADRFDFDALDGFVIDVSRITDINDLYIASDILVTDYSSVMFDYSIMRRPILLYMHDRERYARELRGFYLDPDYLPWPVIENTDDLIDAITSVRNDEMSPPVWEEWVATYAPLDDGDAATRAVEILFPLR